MYFSFTLANLVYNNIANVEKVYCQKSSETNNNSNVFGSLFATVLGPENSRKCKTVTDSTLLVDLLKLSSILILTRIPRSDHENLNTMDEHNLSSESQTDETKVAEQLNEPKEKPLCFADTGMLNETCITNKNVNIFINIYLLNTYSSPTFTYNDSVLRFIVAMLKFIVRHVSCFIHVHSG